MTPRAGGEDRRGLMPPTTPMRAARTSNAADRVTASLTATQPLDIVVDPRAGTARRRAFDGD